MDKLKEYVELVMAKFGDNKKVIIIGLIVVGVILVVGAAQAQPNQDHTCQGGNNCNGGGGSEQGQEQTSINLSHSDSDSSSDSRSSADAGASSNSGGNSLHASGGRSSSSSNAAGGTASATGGVGNGYGGEGGVATAAGGASGDSSASSGGNSQTSDVYVGGDNHDVAASSAASVFAGYCQSGSSGQLEGGGFSVVQTEQFCNYIRLASVMYQAYEREVANCGCVGICTRAEASVVMECQPGENAEKFLDAYYENLWDAQELMQRTEGLALVDRASKQLITPMAILGVLVWLL